MGVWYCNREDVASALDFAETARNAASVDRAIDSASRAVEGLTRRTFFPQKGTRYFSWPNHQYARPWRLWLEADEVITVATVTVGGVTVTDYFLEPINTGPPYTRIEIDLAGSDAFTAGSTHQRAIAITGVFGYSADTEAAGALAEALDASETAADVSDSALVGVGDIIQVESERMLVTGKSMLDTGQNTGAALTASAADVTVPVTTGTAYHTGEVILVGAERMLIVDIAGNNLVVKRAWDGTVLAAHSTNLDIYAPRTLTVTRGALGTTAATHADVAAVYVHAVPGLIRELAIAEAINTLQQQQSGYARTIGEGENAREASGRGLRDLRAEVLARYGRRSRTRAI